MLLCDKGWSIATIAEALLLSEDAIREHITEYRDSKKLKPENGGSTEKLSLKQSELIIGNLRILDQQCLVFFSTLATLGANSILGQDFRSRVRDKFRPIHAPVMGF